MFPKYFSRQHTSDASGKSKVVSNYYRFTVLSDRLVRIEYDPEKIFEDRATQSIVNRYFDTPDFTFDNHGETITIKTKYLVLSCNTLKEPSQSGLSVCVNTPEICGRWNFGDEPDTLKGTYRTLDGIFEERSVTLGEGVCSRNGYAVLDDSKSLILLEDGWISERRDGLVDLYFFGYGHDYLSATKALYKLTGAPPLLPKYVFGNWWSRFENYSEESYEKLISDFEDNDIPLSVSVIDMDWHWSRGEGGKPRKQEWTGYSWNTRLFPDYKRFLNWLHAHNLHPALNLHPAQGVQDHEDMYPEMARAMGIDPETKQTVEFAPENKDFWQPYFDILHHPYEKDGVDFWWMDWQQGTETKIKNLDPLWILNHMHTLDCERCDKRPMFFSRYSGPGSQRFYVGFSGDAYINWDAFAFEPYFTATAANIAFPYWSHDIGGFQHGIRDEELYVRWLQFGVFSPICRLHSTNYDFVSKEPWRFPAEAEKAASELLRLRHKLFPYIYTLNYRAHTDNIALCQPLYYYYPENSQAYDYKNEYFFGSELLVTPVTEHSDPVTGLAKTEIWLPDGTWVDFFNGNVYKGSREFSAYRDIYTFPVFSKAGGIVPMNTHIKGDNAVGSKQDMEIYVFAGASNSFTLYEDDGESNAYRDGVSAVTNYLLDWTDKRAVFTVDSASGNTEILPKTRNYKVYLRGFSPNTQIKVFSGGKEVVTAASYDQKTNTVIIDLKDICVTEKTEIIAICETGLLSQNENYKQRCFDIMLNSRTLNLKKNQVYNDIINDKLSVEKRLQEAEKKVPENSGFMMDAVKEILSLL